MEVDGSSVRKLYVTTIQEKDAGSYTCEGIVDGAKSDRTVILTLFSKSISVTMYSGWPL